MDNKDNFSCPHCRTKLPFRYIMKVKNGHEFECPFCGIGMVPAKTKSFTWGYVIGFFSFVIPWKLFFYLYDDFLLAFMAGLMFSITSFILVSIYIFNNTAFIRSSSTP